MALTLKKVKKIKIPHFWLILVRAYDLKREREKMRREEEDGRRKRRRSSGKETIVRMLVWNCLETLVLEILV